MKAWSDAFHDPIFLALCGAIAFGIALSLWQRKRLLRWRSVVQATAKKHRLRMVMASKWPFLVYADSASGNVDGISLHIDVDSREIDSWNGGIVQEHWLRIKAGADFNPGLLIAERGQHRSSRYAPRVVDYGAKAGKKGPKIGDREFDRRVELHRASDELLDALQTSELKGLVLGLLRHGLRVEHGTVSIRTGQIPKRPHEMLALVDHILELSRQLETLAPERTTASSVAS